MVCVGSSSSLVEGLVCAWQVPSSVSSIGNKFFLYKCGTSMCNEIENIKPRHDEDWLVCLLSWPIKKVEFTLVVRLSDRITSLTVLPNSHPETRNVGFLHARQGL